MTYFVAIAFVAIVASLGAALYFLLHGGSNGTDPSKKMARALGLRVGLSVALFVCILAAWKLGYIQPTGIPVGR